jgi:hypothetical protein
MRDYFGETQAYVRWQKAAEEQKRFDKAKTLSCLASRDHRRHCIPFAIGRAIRKLFRTRSLSVVSEERVSKLHTRARCVCALSIQRLEGRRWRLRRMRANGYRNSIFSPICKLLVLRYLENEHVREPQSDALHSTRSVRRASGLIVCWACSAARRCKSSTQPDGGEGLAMTQGLSPRVGSEGSVKQRCESMNKNRIQGVSVGRAGNVPRSPYSIKDATRRFAHPLPARRWQAQNKIAKGRAPGAVSAC